MWPKEVAGQFLWSVALPADFRSKVVAFWVTDFQEEFHSEIDAAEVGSIHRPVSEKLCVLRKDSIRA